MKKLHVIVLSSIVMLSCTLQAQMPQAQVDSYVIEIERLINDATVQTVSKKNKTVLLDFLQQLAHEHRDIAREDGELMENIFGWYFRLLLQSTPLHIKKQIEMVQQFRDLIKARMILLEKREKGAFTRAQEAQLEGLERQMDELAFDMGWRKRTFVGRMKRLVRRHPRRFVAASSAVFASTAALLWWKFVRGEDDQDDTSVITPPGPPGPPPAGDDKDGETEEERRAREAREAEEAERHEQERVSLVQRAKAGDADSFVRLAQEDQLEVLMSEEMSPAGGGKWRVLFGPRHLPLSAFKRLYNALMAEEKKLFNDLSEGVKEVITNHLKSPRPYEQSGEEDDDGDGDGDVDG